MARRMELCSADTDNVVIPMQPQALDDASTFKDSNDAYIVDEMVYSSDSPLQIACFDGRHKDVDTVLSSCHGEEDKRKMLDAIDNNGCTPLHIACEKEHTEVVKVLMKHGAKPDICSHKDPLYQRVSEGREDIEIKLDDSDKSKEDKNTKDIIESLLADEVPVYNLKCIDKSSNLTYNLSSQFFVGSTPLHVAAKNGSVEVLKVLLSNDVTPSQINCTDTYKRTALYIACKEGHAPVVKLLLEHGADIDNFVDAYKRTALHIACEVGHAQVVELLLEHGADIRLNDDDEHTPIHIACEKGYAQIVELLLQHGADIKPNDVTYNKKMPYARLLRIACKNGHAKVVELLLTFGADITKYPIEDKRKMLDAIDYDNGYTPLHIACEKEHTEVVKVLMKHGAKPDICSHKDPLYQRLSEGSEDIEIELDDSDKSKLEEYYKNTKDIVQFLLAAKVSVYNFKCIDRRNNLTYNMSSQFFVGSTPLHVAAKNGSVEVLKVLLSNDVTPSQINCTDTYKRTALYIACIEGHVPVVKLLLGHKAGIDNFGDAYKRTALHIACEVGHAQVVELLLEYTAKVNLTDDLERTALHIASDKGHAREVELLLEHGADDDEHTALHIACEKGYAQIVELLLQHGANIRVKDVTYYKEVLLASLLRIACKIGHAKVVELLLMYEADVTKCDENGLNPLDIAVEEGKLDVAMAIVNSTKWRDALRSTVMNRRNERRNRIMELLCYNKTEPEFTTPMRRIIIKMPDVAKVIFDRCCRTEASPDHPDYKITFNYEFLEDFDLDGNDKSTKWPPQFKYSSQNHCLNILANSHSADLLKHPLARTLLNLKWNKYGKIIYYTNLMIYFLFVILLTSFALSLHSPNSSICMEAFRNDTNCSKEGSVRQRYLSVASVLLIIISALMMIREIFQVILLRLQYLASFVNFIEVPLFIFTMMFASVRGNQCYCTQSWQWQIGVIAVFLGWIALVFSIRKLPKIGIYVVMFIEIFKNFMKVVILALLLIFAFAFPLFMMFYDPQLKSEAIHTPFITPWRTIVKTIIMTMGEYDMDSLLQQNNQQDSSDIQYPVVAFSLLIVFVVLMPILFLNLLTSLAVGDTQKIQKSADTYRLILKVEFILPMEEFLRNIVYSCLLHFIDTLLLKNRLSHYFAIEREQTRYPNKSGVWKQLIGFIFESKTEGSEPPPATVADVNTQIKPLSEEIKDLRSSVSQEVKKLHSTVSQEVKELRSSMDHLLAIVESMRNEREERAREVRRETTEIRESIGAKDGAKIEGEEQGGPYEEYEL